MTALGQFIKSYYTLVVVLTCGLIGLGLQIGGLGRQSALLLSGISLAIAVKLGVGMIRTLREGRYGIDILAVTAIASTVAVGEHWAAVVIVLMLSGGEALEDYAAGQAKRELSALLERAPQMTHLVTNQGTVPIAVSKVRVGDHLLAKPGEVIPVDAVLLEGTAELDESSLTGESLPVVKKQGDELLSGSVNGNTAITINTLRTARASQYQQIIKLVRAAASTQAPFVRLADRYAVPFTIVSFILAGAAWAVSGHALRFAQVLVVATPCPLLLAAPIALISGMSRAAKNGIIVKSGAILERLATIKAVAFDKTGTLTQGQPAVGTIHPQKGFTKHDLLFYAASTEQQSSHVLAQALVTASNQQGIELQSPQNVTETTAQGISAVVRAKNILVGKRTFLESKHISMDTARLQAGETSVHIAVDGTYAGFVTFSDQLRPQSQEVIQTLRKLGISDILMLTGDASGTADRIAKQVGITQVRAECLPIDKVNAVRTLPVRPVMMVGDGVNDAPVLAVADVGMAMGARGSTAASESADVVVLVDDITKATQAISIAKQTIAIALQSIWIGIAVSLGLMLVAATGVIPAVVGAVLQEVVDVVVIFNALRAHGPWGQPKR